MKLRLFIGIPAPPEWKRVLAAWRQKARPLFTDSFGRWTSKTNLHLTLRFFGSVDEERIAAIDEALRPLAAEAKAFEASPGKFGCFPSATRPRIVWLGLEGTAELIELEKHVRTATAQFGEPPDDRPFHPHLTLVRVKDAQRKDHALLSQMIANDRPIDIPKWRVDELELIRSEPGPDGSIYTTMASFPLCS